jgi:hypothetical protein
MSPWDRLRYLQLPIETDHVSPTNGSVLVYANPMRIVLVISNINAGAARVSAALAPTLNQGWQLPANNPVVVLTAQDHPGLCQAQWSMGSGGGVGTHFTTIEVIASAWPEESTNANDSINTGARSGYRPCTNGDPASTRFGQALRRLWHALPGLRADPE